MSIPAPTLDLAAPVVLPAELRASTAYLLGRLGLAIKAAAMAEFDSMGCNVYEYSVLATLAEGARETQATIADALGLDRGQLVGILDELEERGFIERRRDPRDRRRHTVSLTKAGESELVRLRSVVKHLEDAFLAPLDEESRQTLHDTLLRIGCNYDCRYGQAE
jgi:DNA-binding MarR family transcriptional regulator